MWLAGGLFLDFVASENLRGVDHILHEPRSSASLRIQKMGAAESSMLLHYVVSEQNRHDYEIWENTQMLLSLFFFFYLLFGTRENKFVLGFALLLILVVVLQRFLLTPGTTGLGRQLDFVPDSAPSAVRGRFQALQSTYLGTEIFKWAVQMGLAAMFMVRTRRYSRDSGHKLNVIDKADYGHVNG